MRRRPRVSVGLCVFVFYDLITWDRVFYEIYRHEHEGETPRASCHVYCIKHEDFSCYMYMCFISRRPLTYRVIKVIQYRKGPYDFYYALVTLTTGYKYRYSCTRNVQLIQLEREGKNCISSIQHDRGLKYKYCSTLYVAFRKLNLLTY